MEIETAHGKYEVKRPVGRIGALHLSILMRMDVPSGDPDSWSDEQRREYMQSASKIFEEWADKVLPHLVDNYENIPGEDQFVIFLELAQKTQLPERFFPAGRRPAASDR